MQGSRMLGLVSLMVAIAVAPACSQGEPAPKPSGGPVPAELQAGEAKFTANCSRCHGAGGVGTNQGPPLVHKIYEPNHHGDAAFQRGEPLENVVDKSRWF